MKNWLGNAEKKAPVRSKKNREEKKGRLSSCLGRWGVKRKKGALKWKKFGGLEEKDQAQEDPWERRN